MSETPDKLYVFGRDSRADGTSYPRMALVPDGLFDPAQRMKFRELGVIVEIKRDELPDNLDELPQPVAPEDQVRGVVPLVAIDIQGEKVRRLQIELTEAVAEMERLQKGGTPGIDDGAVRGNVTPEGGAPAYNVLIPDAPSPLDADNTDPASMPGPLDPGASRAATAAYGGNDDEAVAVGTPGGAADEGSNAQELPEYLRADSD